MKKAFFLILVCLCLTSFTTISGNVKNDDSTIDNIDEVKPSKITIDFQYDFDDYQCRIRECTYQNGVLVGCSAWRDCTKEEEEKLAAIVAAFDK